MINMWEGVIFGQVVIWGAFQYLPCPMLGGYAKLCAN